MTLARQATPQAAVKRAVTAIVVITLIYQAMLPMLFAATLAWNDAAKIAITLMVIAPLAYFMGRRYCIYSQPPCGRSRNGCPGRKRLMPSFDADKSIKPSPEVTPFVGLSDSSAGSGGR